MVLTFEAPTIADGGRRLRELASAAESVGFALERARVDDAPVQREEPGRRTPYAPLEDD